MTYLYFEMTDLRSKEQRLRDSRRNQIMPATWETFYLHQIEVLQEAIEQNQKDAIEEVFEELEYLREDIQEWKQGDTRYNGEQ